MKKELSPRTIELKELGFGQDDLIRYEELWDYRQRWGLINLEREDRAFLKKLEKSLPKIKETKLSIKKSLKEKSYYQWLKVNLSEMEDLIALEAKGYDKIFIWPEILKIELEILEKYQPVLGLPDTIKAKKLITIRDKIINESIEKYSADCSKIKFDFVRFLDNSAAKSYKSWTSLKEGLENNNVFPSIDEKFVEEFKSNTRVVLETFIKENFPSLSPN